jgi:hypothetical protein
MTSVASACWGLVFWELDGRAYAAVSGPGTGTSAAPVPEGAAFVGIEFAVGTALRMVPTAALVDGGVELPDVTRRTFRLDGARWETPRADDAEALVERLVRAGAVVRDPLVADVRRGRSPAVSERTVERRFQEATGLTRGPYARSNAPAGPRRSWPPASRPPTSSPGSDTSTNRTWPGRCAGTSDARPGTCARAPAGRSASICLSR